MLAISTVEVLFLSSVSAVHFAKEYKTSNRSQTRIVGGLALDDTSKPPFLAIFNFKPSSSIKCTTSIIHKRWLLSAAHCLVKKKDFIDGTCLSKTKLPFKATCETLDNGDIKARFSSPDPKKLPKVFVGIVNMVDDKIDKENEFTVEEIVLPKDSYKGGQYGDYGGYDIVLIKVDRDMNENVAACLPKKNFDHGKYQPKIAGYGRYRRVPCEVTSQGPEKFQYCQVEPSCIKGNKNYHRSTCMVQFNYKGSQVTGCSTDPTPSADDPLCKSWSKQHGNIDKYMVKGKLDEVVILEKKGGKVSLATVCYRSKPGKLGWCGTTKHIMKGGEYQGKKENEATSQQHWGLCSNDCSLDKSVALSGHARHKDVTIVDQDYCDNYTLMRITGGKGFKVFPKVYCVAFNHTFASQYYMKEKEGFVEIKEGTETFGQQYLDREDSWVIRGTGSCQGDSGGPLYVMDADVSQNERNIHKMGDKVVKYIVIGITSRGSGKLGNCGGAKNPTHYVRVKEFLPWIKRYVPQKEMCLVD